MFTVEYFSKRGPAGAVRLRAIPGANSNIDLDWRLARDQTGQACIPLASTLCNNNRHYAGGQSLRILTFGQFGRGFPGVADMNAVSSLEFRQVYEEGFNVISSPLQHSLAFLTKNQAHSSINFLYDRSAIFFPDPSNPGQNQPSVALQKLPAFEFSLPENAIPSRLPVYFTMDGGLTGVTRRDAQFKTPITERLDIHPSFEIPVLRTDAFEWSHRLGVRETFYTNSRQAYTAADSLNRFVFDYGMRFSGPKLERSFGTWRHIIEPSVYYRYATGAQPFRDTVVVDDVDLLTNTNELEYALTNR